MLTLIGFNVQSDILCWRLHSLVCRTCGKIYVISIGLLCVKFDINGVHVSIQIGIIRNSVFDTHKNDLYEVFLRLQTCIFDNFTKEKALDFNSG